MENNPYIGKFIVFEGLDGSGTTSQANLLYKHLKQKGKKVYPAPKSQNRVTSTKKKQFWCGVYLTGEPTSSLIGGLIKSQIAGEWKSSPECLQLLFTADRAFHLEKEIVPLLKKGINVICTRYILSTLAYGSLEIKDKKWLMEINKNFILPDITFLLKVSPKICIQRIKKERFHKELFEKEEKLKKVWKAYELLRKKFANVIIIDGEKTIEEVFAKVKRTVHSKLNI